MTYNKIRHIELLKRFRDFENQRKDLYTENPDEYMELQEYRIALYNHVCWKRKKEFVLLMENYIHNSIDFEEFEIAFSRLWWETMEVYDTFSLDLKEIKNFEPDLKSDKFGSWVTAIFRQFEVLEDEECTEQEVKDYVRETLRNVQPSL